MQSVKQYDNLRKFPNATSTTSGVGLDKTLAVPVITQVYLKQLSGTNDGDVRQKNTNKQKFIKSI